MAVHGVGYEFDGSHSIRNQWYSWLCDGIRFAGRALPAIDDFTCVIYGDFFRRRGTMSVDIPPYDVSNIEEGVEKELLQLWWHEAAKSDDGVRGPDDATMAGHTRFSCNGLSIHCRVPVSLPASLRKR